MRQLTVIAILLVLSGGVGYFLGQNQVKVNWQNYHPSVSVQNQNPPANIPADFSLFWTVWDRVGQLYVDKSKLDSQKMVYGAISGMVAAVGDPYTVFLPPVKNKESKEDLSGSFEGIGAQLGMKGENIVVVAPLSGTPAEAAGVKSGDWIVKIDGQDTAKLTLPEAVTKIRGPRGTRVTLTVLHDGATNPVDLTITRDTITVASVEEKITESTASGKLTQAVYIKLSRFGDSTNSEWDAAVTKAVTQLDQNKDLKGVILDLRNDPGGFLDSAVYVASEFLPDGLIVRQANGDGTSQDYTVNRLGKFLKVPVVVLINGGSASASEIVAGALQARGRAKLVGTQSFGKGSVQEAQDLPGGAGLHVTISKWLLPNDQWINGTGLTPDVKVKNSDTDPTKDLQLDKAVEVLNK